MSYEWWKFWKEKPIDPYALPYDNFARVNGLPLSSQARFHPYGFGGSGGAANGGAPVAYLHSRYAAADVVAAANAGGFGGAGLYAHIHEPPRAMLPAIHGNDIYLHPNRRRHPALFSIIRIIGFFHDILLFLFGRWLWPSVMTPTSLYVYRMKLYSYFNANARQFGLMRRMMNWAAGDQQQHFQRMLERQVGLAPTETIRTGTRIVESIDRPRRYMFYATVLANDYLRQIIVVFHGASNPADQQPGSATVANSGSEWVRYLDPCMTAFPRILDPGTGELPAVCQMFLNSYQSGAEDLYAAVVRQMRSKPSGYYDLILTGHSLGGAHAYLAAIDFQIRDRSLANVTSIYTYGAPRVGNQAFADYFDRIPFRFSARVTAARDMIPTLPSHLHGYVHVREEFYIRRDAEVQKCRAPWNGGESNIGINSLVEYYDIHQPQIQLSSTDGLRSYWFIQKGYHGSAAAVTIANTTPLGRPY